jgi:hypothetical protein
MIAPLACDGTVNIDYHGKVYDKMTGLPLANVTVYCRTIATDSGWIASHGPVFTDSTGVFHDSFDWPTSGCNGPTASEFVSSYGETFRVSRTGYTTIDTAFPGNLLHKMGDSFQVPAMGMTKL